MPAAAPAEPAHVFTMPRARLYLGGAGAASGEQTGQAGVIGFQWFNPLGPNTASYFGLEVLGAKVGTNGILPVFTGDFGLRWAPFPEAFLRPYLRGSVGLSLLVILPVPSLSLGVGVAVPVANTFALDVSLGYRHAFNLFDATQPLRLATLDLGVGF